MLVADSFLGCLFIGGIEGMLFSLIPLRFLPGARVKQWGWVPWVLLTALTCYVFVHVLLVPASGYLGGSTTASTNVTIALFAAFGVLSTAVLGVVPVRPEKTGLPGPCAGPPEGEAVRCRCPCPNRWWRHERARWKAAGGRARPGSCC